jgi:serine/threonine protein phosphatase PrpC
MTRHDSSYETDSWQGVALTDQGRVRTSNQDAFAVLNQCGVWMVADGMGGRAGGDIASRIVVDYLADELAKNLGTRVSESTQLESRADLLRDLIQASNQAVLAEASRRPEFTGMGTTLVVLMVLPQPRPTALVAHVGDSRAYCLRSGVLTQVTRDHSFVEESLRNGHLTEAEALNHPLRHMLTRAVGAEPHLETEITIHLLTPEDSLLLCTDGLTKMLPDPVIRKTLLHYSADLLQSCRALVNEANARGGDDNTTVVLTRNNLTK